MKLLTYSWKGHTGLGALAGEWIVRLPGAYAAAMRYAGDEAELAVAPRRVPNDLASLLRGGEASLAAARRAFSFAMDHGSDIRDSLFCPVSETRFLPPVEHPGKIVCVGLNYRSHLAEINEAVPEYPILFTKVSTCLVGDGEAVVLPRISQQVDYEGELAVVIGRRGKDIAAAEALDYVAGYTCANDVSAHDIEFRTSQWTSGKMLDTFCPLGPVVLTRDEVEDPTRLRLRTKLNGRIVQDASTADMVFSVATLVSYVSSLATIEPGDLLLTGTPAGIGCNKNPQVFLQPGDRVEVEIEGIGVLSNPVISERGR